MPRGLLDGLAAGSLIRADRGSFGFACLAGLSAQGFGGRP